MNDEELDRELRAAAHEALDRVAAGVDAEGNRDALERRLDSPVISRRHGSRVLVAAAAAMLIVVAIVALAWSRRDGQSNELAGQQPAPSVPMAPVPAPAPAPADSVESMPATSAEPTSTVPSSSPTPTSVPPTMTVAPPEQLPIDRVVPFGARSHAASSSSDPDRTVSVWESDVESVPLPVEPGGVVLQYRLGLEFSPTETGGTVEAASMTADGELSVEVTCPVPDCLDLKPVNDAVQNRLQVTIRQSGESLSAGDHLIPFALRYDDGSTIEFEVALLAEQEPSAAFSEMVQAATGAPQLVQTVVAPGAFAYHAISAFDAIWIIDSSRKTVTRIDAITGELLTTIPLTDLPGPYGSTGNRLAATTDAVWAVGEPAFRIDPATNQVTEIGGGDQAYAIAADGTTVWTAGFEGTIQRIEPDGTITTVYAPPDGEPRRAFMDLVVADGKLWALSQTRGNSRLLAIDPVTGDVAHDLLLSGDISTIGVRVVADQHGIVVGADTSGGGGRTGELYLIDPTTGTITDTVELPSRPEGIALTDDHIFTSAAVVDRHSLDVVDDTPFGFSIARGPDGSIWGTGAIEGSRSITFAARRFAPGDLG